MQVPQVLLDHLPTSWRDETLLREEIVSLCKERLDEIVSQVIARDINYLHDNQGMADVLIEYMPVYTMTEDEFGYVIQMVITKCVLIELELAGLAEEVEPGQWKLNLEKK